MSKCFVGIHVSEIRPLNSSVRFLQMTVDAENRIKTVRSFRFDGILLAAEDI